MAGTVYLNGKPEITKRKSGTVYLDGRTPQPTGKVYKTTESEKPLGSTGMQTDTLGKQMAYQLERGANAVLGVGEGIVDAVSVPVLKTAQALTSSNLLSPITGQKKEENKVSQFLGKWADSQLAGGPTKAHAESIERRYNPDKYTKFGGDVVSVVSGILPAASTGIMSQGQTAINAGKGILNAVAQNGAKSVLLGSAIGNSSQEAYQEGADANKALAYGGLAGGLELAIEGIAGGIPGLPEGKVTQIAKSFTKSPLAKTLADVLGEGGEEALNTVLTPYLKRAVYDENAQNATAEEIVQSAVMGALASGILQGTSGNLSLRLKEKKPTVKLNGQVEQEASKIEPQQQDYTIKDEKGTPITVFHGTNADFKNFDVSKINSNEPAGDFVGRGIFFTPDKSKAQGYGNNIKSANISMKNPLVIETKEDINNLYNQFGGIVNYVKLKKSNPQAVQNKLIELGYDGLIDKMYNQYAVFEPTQIHNLQHYDIFGNRSYQQENVKAETTPVEQETAVETQNKRSTKAMNAENLAKSYFYNDVGEALSIPRNARKSILSEIADDITNQIYNGGKVSQQAIDKAFENSYNSGIVEMDEFYKTYKPLKDEIRTTGLVLSEKDSHDVKDFSIFRKNNFNTVKLVKYGMPVDVYYDDLVKRYPSLFDAEITHPADQLQEIARVAKEIQKTEVDLNAFYGEDAPTFKSFAKQKFDEQVTSLIDSISKVKRYEDAQINKAQVNITDTQEFSRISSELEKARRERDKLSSKLLLTQDDRAVLRDLVTGRRTTLPTDTNINVTDIKKLYPLEKIVYEYSKATQDFKKQARSIYQTKVQELLEGSEAWTEPKAGFALQTNTMERNINNIVKDTNKAKALNAYFIDPIHAHEAQAVRRTNQLVTEAKNLNLDNKKLYDVTIDDGKGNTQNISVTESGLVQLYGEKKIGEPYLKQLGADIPKIKRATEWFRNTYDTLLNDVNDVYIKNGFAPIEKRADYFPHFQEEVHNNKVYEVMGKILQTKIMENALPTAIAGKTANFKPFRKWNANALHRISDKTQYDALQGFERYLNTAMDSIYHTEDITKLRILESELRNRFTPEGTQERIDQIRNDERLTDNEKDTMIAEILKEGQTHLSNFTQEIMRYTDNLAGKKNISDRDWEQKLGRGIYDLSKALEGRIASNMIGFNISSAFTNVIPLTQATAEIPLNNIGQGIAGFIKNQISPDSFVEQSDFLTNRRGTERLLSTNMQKVQDAGGWLMGAMDNIVSESIVRARYQQNIDSGMNHTQAMLEANKYTAGLMADRSKGSLPTIFNEQNPVMKAFSMFQLEVNNQLHYMYEDLPQNIKARYPEKKLAAEVTKSLFKMFMAAFLYNELFERMTGRRAALDPIGIAQDFATDTASKGLGSAMGGLATNVVQEVPFIGGIMGGGRLPISSAAIDGKTLSKNFGGLLDGSIAPKKALSDIGGELASSSALLALPTGGNQLKKTIQGIGTFAKGGSYKYDKDGNPQMQFSVAQTPGNFARSALFGKWSTPEAKKYIDNGFKSMSAKQTAAMQNAVKKGIDQGLYISVYEATKGVQSDKDKDGLTVRLSKDRKRKQIIDQMVTDKWQRKIMYDALDISDALR